MEKLEVINNTEYLCEDNTDAELDKLYILLLYISKLIDKELKTNDKIALDLPTNHIIFEDKSYQSKSLRFFNLKNFDFQALCVDVIEFLKKELKNFTPDNIPQQHVDLSQNILKLIKNHYIDSLKDKITVSDEELILKLKNSSVKLSTQIFLQDLIKEKTCVDNFTQSMSHNKAVDEQLVFNLHECLKSFIKSSYYKNENDIINNNNYQTVFNQLLEKDEGFLLDLRKKYKDFEAKTQDFVEAKINPQLLLHTVVNQRSIEEMKKEEEFLVLDTVLIGCLKNQYFQNLDTQSQKDLIYGMTKNALSKINNFEEFKSCVFLDTLYEQKFAPSLIEYKVVHSIISKLKTVKNVDYLKPEQIEKATKKIIPLIHKINDLPKEFKSIEKLLSHKNTYEGYIHSQFIKDFEIMFEQKTLNTIIGKKNQPSRNKVKI